MRVMQCINLKVGMQDYDWGGHDSQSNYLAQSLALPRIDLSVRNEVRKR